MEPLVLIGGGGHCRSCLEVIRAQGRYQVAGIVDRPAKLHQRVDGCEIFATDDDLERLAREYPWFLITVGQVKTPEPRRRLFERVTALGGRLATVVSPLAWVSSRARLGPGTVVMHHGLVNTGARVGRNCIINSKALVEHDAVIGDHCHLATAAVVNGGARIGAGVLVGTNAAVCQGVVVGEGQLVPGGCLVRRDMPARLEVVR